MQTLHILKVGGRVVEEPQGLADILDTFQSLEGYKILVHGGGNRATELAARLGIQSQMVNGRRITDADTLDVVVMTYAGLINKQLVSQLQARSINALGLSGADGNTLLAHKRPVKDIDYGFAGDIDQVNSQSFHALLQAGFIPVCCAITHNGKGQLLNTNADTIASVLAIAMSQFYRVSLKLCFDKPGVLTDASDERSVIPHINPDNYQTFREQGIIFDGMIPKLDNAFAALAQGVQEIVLGNPASIRLQTGTVIVANQ